MKKLLLTGIFAIFGTIIYGTTNVTQASAIPIIDGGGVVPLTDPTDIGTLTVDAGAASTWEQNPAGYRIKGTVTINFEPPSPMMSGNTGLTAKQSVTILSGGKLIVNGGDASFEEELIASDQSEITTSTIDLGGRIRPAVINVDKRLKLIGVPVLNGQPIIKVRGQVSDNIPRRIMNGEPPTVTTDGIFDASEVNGVLQEMTINGGYLLDKTVSEPETNRTNTAEKNTGNTFLGYYSTEDTGDMDYFANADFPLRLYDIGDETTRTNYANAIKERLSRLISSKKPNNSTNNNANYLKNVTLNNVKIQDHIIEKADTAVTYNSTSKSVSYDGAIKTIITNADGVYTRYQAEKKGLIVVDAPNTEVNFDFYSNFNTEEKNDNKNSFIKWPENIQIALSSYDGSNTEFEFKTKLAYNKDLSVTNGSVSFSKLIFSGDNTGFVSNKVKLNDKLNEVNFAASNSYVAVDFTSCNPENKSFLLKFLDESGTNDIKRPPISLGDQKITFDTGAGNNITFNEQVEIPTIDSGSGIIDAYQPKLTRYEFDSFIMGDASTVTVNRGAELVI